jgi:carboxyl-terminal processing protease
MVRLTTAHYYTPSGRCIQKPYENGVEDYRTDYEKRMKRGEMFYADSISFPDSLKYKTLETNRTVYGGGGIMPDIFVPMDTSSLYRYINRLQRSNITYNYTLDYLDQNRSGLLKTYPDFRKFLDNFTPGDNMIEAIVASGEKEGIPRDQESLEFTLHLIKKEIKSYLARNLYAAENFYEVYNQDDDMIKKALEVILDNNQYNQLLVSFD